MTYYIGQNKYDLNRMSKNLHNISDSSYYEN